MTRFLFLAVVAAVATMMQAAVEDTQATDFKKIIALDKVASEARQAELQATDEQTKSVARIKRENAYWEAARAVDAYIRKWEPQQTIQNLREHFRLATYWELGDFSRSALDEYRLCKKHPLLKEADAVWNGERLSVLVDRRIDALETLARTRSQRMSCTVALGFKCMVA